jgi:hypothetical protein
MSCCAGYTRAFRTFDWGHRPGHDGAARVALGARLPAIFHLLCQVASHYEFPEVTVRWSQ